MVARVVLDGWERSTAYVRRHGRFTVARGPRRTGEVFGGTDGDGGGSGGPRHRWRPMAERMATGEVYGDSGGPRRIVRRSGRSNDEGEDPRLLERYTTPPYLRRKEEVQGASGGPRHLV